MSRADEIIDLLQQNSETKAVKILKEVSLVARDDYEELTSTLNDIANLKDDFPIFTYPAFWLTLADIAKNGAINCKLAVASFVESVVPGSTDVVADAEATGYYKNVLPLMAEYFGMLDAIAERSTWYDLSQAVVYIAMERCAFPPFACAMVPGFASLFRTYNASAKDKSMLGPDDLYGRIVTTIHNLGTHPVRYNLVIFAI
jgi:hypothetical protein